MPKLLTQARAMCPELLETVKELDSLAYSRQYSDVFADMIDWLVWQHSFPPNENTPLEKYNEEEQTAFLNAFKIIQQEVKQRVSLWTEQGTWYDPFGRIYECITSQFKSSRMGQYFTPEPVVDMMVGITNTNDKSELKTILDPACGSGRMGLAAAHQSLKNRVPCWVSMNDLDPICTKMAAVNMALNGVIGEAICMNGLDLSGETYRFGYRVEPAIAQYPPETWEYYRMLLLMKTGQDIKKQYVLKSVPYARTYLAQVNGRLQEEYQKRLEIEDQVKQEVALQEIKNQVKARMAGTLFEGDESQLENIELPKQSPTKRRRSKSEEDDTNQGTLF